jgi:hypothetical protein
MPLAVLFEDAAVHHHKDSRLPRFLCRGLMFHFFLHPDARDAQLNRVVNDFRNELGTSEDVDDVNFLRDIEQRWVGLFAEGAVDAGIHGDNAITVKLHVRRDAIAWADRARRQADDRNGFRGGEHVGNLVSGYGHGIRSALAAAGRSLLLEHPHRHFLQGLGNVLVH